MKTRLILSIILISFINLNLSAQVKSKTSAPSTSEKSTALKEALGIGVKRAVEVLSRDSGFLADKQVRIQFPQEIQKVDKTLRSMGLSKLSDNFVKQLNTGAEKAVTLATPIMIKAIQNMSITDATGILLGGEGSATKYFESKTKDSLYTAFKPKVKEVLDQYGISKSYSSLMSKYNTMPFVSKANADLNDYVTKETLKGLFVKLAQEENKIRSDSKAQTTTLLKKVFGSISQTKTAK